MQNPILSRITLHLAEAPLQPLSYARIARECSMSPADVIREVKLLVEQGKLVKGKEWNCYELRKEIE